jgi:hypothetical protein
MSVLEKIQAVIAELGLSMTADFFPWSQSRRAGEKEPSLSWKVTLFRTAPTPGVGAKVILATDYSAGSGHCPSYKQLVPGEFLAGQQAIMIRRECETGRSQGRGKHILPEMADVLSCLISEADAIDHTDFESWADSLGYDSDSRKAEAVYQACLKTALALRNALGEDGLRKLRDAFQDY